MKSDPNGAYNIIDIAKYQGEPEFDEILKNVALRLVTIEDILGDEYDLDELKEVVQAKREERCVVLPCKVGDTIYFVGEEFYNYQLHSGLQKGRVKGFEFDKTWLVWVHFEKDTPTAGVAFKVKDFGKTVFLTRADAEAALRREQDG